MNCQKVNEFFKFEKLTILANASISVWGVFALAEILAGVFVKALVVVLIAQFALKMLKVKTK